MERETAKCPFEADAADLAANEDRYVDAVFASLGSEFMVMPRGSGFVDYATFESGYEALKKGTEGFVRLNCAAILPVVQANPIAFVVLRAMLGFTPPEWAYVASQQGGVTIDQGAVRTLDRRARTNPGTPFSAEGPTAVRLRQLVVTAARLLSKAPPRVGADKLHRLDKADTIGGAQTLRTTAGLGMPYAMVLYERFLGRPFAGHRDSVSELVGDSLESAIEDLLCKAGVSYRKTKRAEKLIGFEQAPDFIVPSEQNPQIVIEAKLTEDDGTARDKVARIQQLDHLRRNGQPGNRPRYELVACIAGRGFGVRREDMKRLLRATDGKVFTLRTLARLVDSTGITAFRTR